MQVQYPSFMTFMLQLTFRITCFQKRAYRHGGKHNFEKRLRVLSIKHLTFLTPKRLKKQTILSFLLALVALLLVRFAMCSLLAPFRNSLWLDSRAAFASKPRLQERQYA